MIGSFADKDAEQIFQRQRNRRYSGLERVIYRRMLIVQAAGTLLELSMPPGNRLEALKGDRSGQHSIRINDQLRICFVWREPYAEQLEIVDYH